MHELTADVDTFGIVLPEDWMRIPLEADEFEAFARGQRRRLSGDGEMSRTAARQFELLLRQLRGDALREHVTLAASMIVLLDDSPDDEGETVEAGLLTAACTISSIDRCSMGSDLPLTVNTIAAAMGRTPPVDDDGAEISNLEPPEIVDLPAGQTVRLVRLHRYPTSEVGEQLNVFAQHFFVPFGDGQRSALASFSSVTPEYARPLSRLFDHMMETFRMFGGDMSTDPGVVGLDTDRNDQTVTAAGTAVDRSEPS